MATVVALEGTNAPGYPAVARSPTNRRLSETKRRLSRPLSADFSEVIPVLRMSSGANAALLRRREFYKYNATGEEESGAPRSLLNDPSRSYRNSLVDDDAIEGRVYRIGKSKCPPNERHRLGELMKNYGTRLYSSVSSTHLFHLYLATEYFSGPGATFGELALLNPHSTRNASIVADTECDLLVVSRALYKSCIKACSLFLQCSHMLSIHLICKYNVY